MLEKFDVGIDIVQISRFKQLPYTENKKFYHNIFKKSEICYCTKYKDPYPHFAGRFAIKEAVIKSIKNKIKMTDIEVILNVFAEELLKHKKNGSMQNNSSRSFLI